MRSLLAKSAFTACLIAVLAVTYYGAVGEAAVFILRQSLTHG